MRYEKRLHALEARRQAQDRPAYDLIDALHRACTAAVRDKIRRRLDGLEDTPEQAAQDAALLAQWRAVDGLTEATGARKRIAARLDRMAERLHAASVTRTKREEVVYCRSRKLIAYAENLDPCIL